MASSHNSPQKGYLIPDDPSPDGLNCVLVFYPDDPLYYAALIGSLSFLGTWVAWEKDGTTRARQAAIAWKEANEATMANCLDDLVTALAGIQAAIENQENICAPVVNVDSCCPATPSIPDDETGNDPPANTTPIGDPSSDPPPDGYPTWPDYFDAKCLAANYIADKVIQLANSIATFASMGVIMFVQNLVTQMSLIIPSGWLLALGGWVMSNAVVNLIIINDDDGLPIFTEFADALETNKSDFVCSLYSWLSADNALTAVSAFIDAIIDTLNISALSKTALSAFWGMLLSSRFMNWYTEELEAIVPEGYTGTIDCASCGCPNYRAILQGIGVIGTNGETGTFTIQTVQIEPGTNIMEIQLDGNYCLKLYSIANNSFEAWQCVDGELVPATITPEYDYSKTCASKLYLDMSTAVTLDLEIVESNPDCNCDPLQALYSFTNDAEGWYFVDEYSGLVHGEWTDSGGYDDAGCLKIYTDYGAVIRGGSWRLDVENYNIVVQAGYSLDAWTKSLLLPNNAAIRVSVRFTDGTWYHNQINNNSNWVQIQGVLSAFVGKTIGTLVLYAGQSSSNSNTLSQLWDKVELNFNL